MGDDKIEIDACWSRIGVWRRGGEKCPELDRLIHCANCRIFMDAGRKLFDKPAPTGYLYDWAKLLVEPAEVRSHNTLSALIFRLGDEWLALPTTLVEEVVQMRPVHRVPHKGSTILRGLINIRGELQLCVSIGRLLNISRGDVSGTNVVKGIYERLIVVSHVAGKYVFPVSEIRGVHRYSHANLNDAPATTMNCAVHFIKGMIEWENHRVGLIDHDLLFSSLEQAIQ